MNGFRAASWCLLVACAVGCGSSGEDGSAVPAGNGPASGTGGDDTIFNTGSGASNGSGSAGNGVDGCVGEVAKAEAIPFDLYVMFDQSGSMVASTGSGTRLDAIRAAFADFLRDPESTGLGVGIGYFGDFPIGQTSCDPGEYTQPSVGIDLLPDHAGAVLNSLNAVTPTGETPTGAAIRGACNYAKSWSAENTGTGMAIVLMTDGVPEAPLTSQSGGCNPTLDDAIAATEACARETGLSLYVVGVGPSLTNLNQIARAGETDSAYLVEEGDVSKQVLDALNAIRGNSVLPCALRVPDPPQGEALDYSKVNVVLTEAGDSEEFIPFVRDADRCDDELGGWHYDEDRERIVLCEPTCDRVRGESVGGQLSISLGCEQVALIR